MNHHQFCGASPVAKVYRKNSSRAEAIRAFFDANPEEALTIGDIALKFACTEMQALYAYRQLKREGLLRSAFVVMRATNLPSVDDQQVSLLAQAVADQQRGVRL